MVANSYLTNYTYYVQSDVVDLLASGFTGILKSWWDKYLNEESRKRIQNAIQVDENNLPIFDENIGTEKSNEVNTLIYTIIKYVIRTPSDIHSRIQTN